MTAAKTDAGVSLVAVLVATGFFSVTALGLALLVSSSIRADGHYIDSVVMLNAAEAGIELAARDLAVEADWDLVLRGVKQARIADGAPSGRRSVPYGGTLDLTLQTNLLNCGRAAGCTTAQMSAISRDRPWGTNNPRWQPYLYGPASALGGVMRDAPLYVVVWVGDDGLEGDGDPFTDERTATSAGRGIVSVRSEVFGSSGARRAIEALVMRVCWSENSIERCLQGARVQSWREVRQGIP